ncbi:hypothetical protein W97_04256 [Coniosporium apollinis CBS 100218]|uniref:Glutathione S-transferase kappa n=1 Tax=Coniosporium apollinis (strain CBS 100218) TaxID=1168221 RepID=R7YTL7_CONA1|nr:uncharacterized protein W97_04256 [Coniosporium apollinis CBS 100218]EON65021.1 hypothetical protein W97_04256 [Coniosporium apollinis CBS 100218]
MPNPKITFYVDIVSPFAYLAFYALNNFPVFAQCEITYIPIFLGGVMKACGNTPPLRIKNKAEWVGRERDRWAKKFNIPIMEGVPEGFPVNTITPQRALSLIAAHNPTALRSAIAACYDTFWVRGKPIQDPAILAAALASVLGQSQAQEVMNEVGSQEARNLLSENTEEALREGAFGLPWIVATNPAGEKEAFWGFDHLAQVVDHLGLERPREGPWRALL